MQYLEPDEVNVTETRSHRYPTYATPILIIVRYCIYKNIQLIFFFLNTIAEWGREDHVRDAEAGWKLGIGMGCPWSASLERQTFIAVINL